MIKWKNTNFTNSETPEAQTLEAKVAGKKFVVTRLHIGQSRHTDRWYVSYCGFLDEEPTKATDPEAVKLEAVAMLAERTKRILAEIEG